VGNVVYYITFQNRYVFVFFPNIFDFYFLVMSVADLMGIPDLDMKKYQYHIIVSMSVVQIIREYLMHVDKQNHYKIIYPSALGTFREDIGFLFFFVLFYALYVGRDKFNPEKHSLHVNKIV
jgi:hypothetical protein